jgi:dUTP pyrophosphatase
MKVKVKGNIPKYAKHGDAGADLIADRDAILYPLETVPVPTGTYIEIPDGYVGLIHPRSGLAAKYGITVLNSPGTIDSGYRGEIVVLMQNTTEIPLSIAKGERIAQLVIQEFVTADFELVDELSDSDRGDGGFGSTGK